MLNFKFIISGLILLVTLLFHEVEATCQLQIHHENKPLLIQKFGSKEIIIQGIDSIYLDENDEIQAYCATGFMPFTVINNRYGSREMYNSANKQILNFYCESNKIRFNKQYSIRVSKVFDEYSDNNDESMPMSNIELYEEFIPKCSGRMYAMFESRNKLPNCEDALSYVLGAKLNTPIIIAGLCFDLDRLKLNYVSYKLREPSSILEKFKELYPMGLNGNSLSYPLTSADHLFKFPSDLSIQTDLKMQAMTNFWLQIANYELDNIVQTTTRGLKLTLDDFKDFFNIIWWRNLRIGNWRRFMQLLDKRSKDVEYNVYTGTSGKLLTPVEKQKCDNVSSMELELSAHAVIPQFVWIYLNSISEETVEDFVVIAYNSPYFEYFDQNATIICNDMCNTIDWLQPIEDSRLVAALGRLYCCRSDEVVSLLDGFPLKPANQLNLTTEATVEY